MTFIDFVKQGMIKKGWNEADLARAADISPQGINFLLNGRTKKPSTNTIEKITKAFGLPVEEGYIAAKLLPPESKLDARRRRIIEKIKQIESDKDLETLEGLANILLRLGNDSAGEAHKKNGIAPHIAP